MPSARRSTSSPWAVRETELNLDVLAQSESVFALSNGHIGLRGNLDEGEPHGLPGTYLNGFFESRPLPYAEAGYGYPEYGQTVINVTNGKLIRLLVGDSLLDVRYGELAQHERTLDLRAGTLTREVEWITPTGHAVRIRSVRFVSFAQRAIAAIRYEVEPLGGPARVVLQSELVANEPLPAGGDDPRAAAVPTPLRARVHRRCTTAAPCWSTRPSAQLLRHRRGDGPRDRGARRSSTSRSTSTTTSPGRR